MKELPSIFYVAFALRFDTGEGVPGQDDNKKVPLTVSPAAAAPVFAFNNHCLNLTPRRRPPRFPCPYSSRSSPPPRQKSSPCRSSRPPPGQAKLPARFFLATFALEKNPHVLYCIVHRVIIHGGPMKKLSFLIFCILNIQNIHSQSHSGAAKIPLVVDFGICGVIQTNIYDNDGDTIINGYGGLGLTADLRIEFSKSVGFLWGWNIKWLPIGTAGSYTVYKTVLTDVENIDDSQGTYNDISCFGGSTYIALFFKMPINNTLGILTSMGIQCSMQEENQIIDITYINAEISREVDFKKTTTDIGPMIAISLFKNHNNYRSRSFSSGFSIGLHGSLTLFRHEKTFMNDNRIHLKNNYLGFEIMPYISWSYK
jgi:hypothetical protein